VLNAGFAGFTGLNWFRAVFFILTDLVHAVTWPSVYTRSDTGVLVKKQTSLPDEPPLGQIFCANVFGHYMLSHNLMPLLKVSTDPPGRIIWTSSLEATPAAFNIDDIQALQIARPYESAKYLTDLLALTSSLPSTAPNVSSFLSPSSPTSKIKSGPDSNTLLSTEPAQNQTEMPKIYATHPGICATSIVPLILPLHYCMMAAFFLARMLGSPWHVISSYTGACSTIWLSLAPQSVLDAAEAAYTRMGGGGKVKWGSSCDRLGRERVVCTEVEGWGFGGVVGPPVTEEDKRRRRKRGMRDLTTEERVEFEELGRKSWREMEELRVQWEELLSRAEAQKEASSS
jgi:3-keto steroid reductase